MCVALLVRASEFEPLDWLICVNAHHVTRNAGVVFRI